MFTGGLTPWSSRALGYEPLLEPPLAPCCLTGKARGVNKKTGVTTDGYRNRYQHR